MRKRTLPWRIPARHPGNIRWVLACWMMIGILPGACAGSLTQNNADGAGLGSALMNALPASPETVAPGLLPPPPARPQAQARRAVKKRSPVGPAPTPPAPTAIPTPAAPPHAAPSASVAPALSSGHGVTKVRNSAADAGTHPADHAAAVAIMAPPASAPALPDLHATAHSSAAPVGAVAAGGGSKLHELLATALANNSDIRLADQSLREAQAESLDAFGQFLPHLNFQTQTQLYGNQTNQPSVSLIGSTIVVTQGNNYSNYLSVMASLNLFEGGQGIANLAASRQGVHAGHEQVSERRRRTALNVLAGYEGLQSLQWQLRAIQRSLVFMRQDLALAEQRMRQGNESRIDLNQMRSQVANLEAQRQDTKKRLVKAQTNLALLTGKTGAFDLLQSGVHDSIPTPPEFDAATVEGAAVENLPSVQVARAALRKARDRVDAVRGSFLPNVNLQTGYNWIGTSSQGFGRAIGSTSPSNYTVGISITQTLAPFTGHMAKLDTAEARSEAALIRYQRALQEGRQELRVNQEEVRSGTARLAALESVYARARQNQQLMEELYAHGRISKIDLHAAQIKTMNAEDACRDARAQLQVARWMLYAMVDPRHVADSLLQKTQAGEADNAAPSASGAGAEHT